MSAPRSVLGPGYSPTVTAPAADENLADPGLRKPLHELADGDCRWPTGFGASVTFCGHPVARDGDYGPHGRYCAHHIAWSRSETVGAMRTAARAGARLAAS